MANDDHALRPADPDKWIDEHGFTVVPEEEWSKAGVGQPQQCGGCGKQFTPTAEQTFPYTVDGTTTPPTVEQWLYVCPDCMNEHDFEDEWWDEL